jgi:mannitol operon repressor
MRQEDVDDFNAFLKEFNAETDRGAALVGAALLDERLREVLMAFFADRKVGADLMDGGLKPLGTLSARIKLALCLGLIDRHEFHECDIIRRVRNEFAHRRHGTSFSDPKIASECMKLKTKIPEGLEDAKGNPRFHFVMATIMTVLALTHRSAFAELDRREIRNWSV